MSALTIASGILFELLRESFSIMIWSQRALNAFWLKNAGPNQYEEIEKKELFRIDTLSIFFLYVSYGNVFGRFAAIY